MSAPQDGIDPRGLIRESYRIEGITLAECRSIFLDWAISVPVGEDSTAHVRVLLDTYATDAEDHPMTRVLREALEPAARTGRRGGARARRK
ncbi:MAG: hypothetical protein AAF718_02185 [Pseudomonadota bacterium]